MVRAATPVCESSSGRRSSSVGRPGAPNASYLWGEAPSSWSTVLVITSSVQENSGERQFPLWPSPSSSYGGCRFAILCLCRKSFIRPLLCKPLFHLCFCCPVFSFVLLIFSTVCVVSVSGRICAAVFFGVGFFVFFFAGFISFVACLVPFSPPLAPLPTNRFGSVRVIAGCLSGRLAANQATLASSPCL